ncbi:MAG TPA: hypothetical protein VH642_12275, partial [Streptosporangiaceae bacterium]
MTAPILAAYIAGGGPRSPWGLPTGDTSCGRAQGGCVQAFENRLWATSPGTGGFAIRAPQSDYWLASGGEAGVLGYPTADRTCSAADACRQEFQGGLLATSPATGTRTVTPGYGAVWAAQNWGGGPLGYPTSELICGLKGGGCGQLFQGGRVYDTAATGAHALGGEVLAGWIAAGAEAGRLGYPTGDLLCGLSGGGCRQEFQGGLLATSPGTGTRVVPPGTGAVWAAQSWEGGPLGYPTSGPICGLAGGGCGQLFEGGRVYDKAGTGAHALRGEVLTAWIAAGAEAGRLGYPTGDLVCGLTGGGCRQDFQGGTLWSHAAGTHRTTGDLAAAWQAAGGEGGALGYPTTGPICGLTGGGCGQLFEGGRIYHTAGTGAHVVTGAFLDSWIAAGAEAGRLGYPTADQACGLLDSGCGQVFQRGRIYSTAATGTHAVAGAFYTLWAGQGYEGGPLGYPTSGQVCGLAGGGCEQHFQGGALYYSSTTGTRVVAGAVATAHRAAGGRPGALGFPTSGLICGLTGGGCGQLFQG